MLDGICCDDRAAALLEPTAAVLGAAKLDEERRPLLRVDGHVSDAGRV